MAASSEALQGEGKPTESGHAARLRVAGCGWKSQTAEARVNPSPAEVGWEGDWISSDWPINPEPGTTPGNDPIDKSGWEALA